MPFKFFLMLSENSKMIWLGIHSLSVSYLIWPAQRKQWEMEYPIRKEEKEIGGKNGLKEARSSAFKW